MTPFGPQAANAATSIPTPLGAARYGTTDTFVRDCSAIGANDGTVLDAAFFNRILTNLAYLVNQSGITWTLGDQTIVYRAVAAIVSSATSSLVADEFTATASQIVFPLSKTPKTAVVAFRNGVRLPNSSFAVSGSTATYNAAANGGTPLAAADRINLDYGA